MDRRMPNSASLKRCGSLVDSFKKWQRWMDYDGVEVERPVGGMGFSR